MNERVKSVLLAAIRLSPDERRALAGALADHLDTDLAEAERLFGDATVAEEKPGLPATDTLSKYLDT